MEAAAPAAAAAVGGGGPASSGAGRDNSARPAAAGGAASTAATTPEEEALKRNTDCVYFLASPLTCKKGADCEYRHSEGARINPRDCYYWLNGNCLNPKCSFRHPPLEGLFGATATSPGSLLPPQAATPTQAAPYTTRQTVPCYYFQRGLCLKGDRCPFSHGVTAMPNPVSQQTPKLASQAAEQQQTFKKPSWTVEKCNQNVPKDNVSLPVVASSKRGPAVGAGGAPANGLAVKNNIQLRTEISSRPETSNVPLSIGSVPNRLHAYQSRPEINNISVGTGNVPNRLQTYQSDLANEHLQNEREGDEFMHESSPGFDVLVDDENEDPGYYHNEDDYRDASGNDGRSFKPLPEFDYSQNSEYENTARFSRERVREEGEYNDHVQLRDRYDRERRISSDRMLERTSAPKRPRRADIKSEVDGSDLRHRLKQRRLTGRSGFSPDQPSEMYRRTDRHTEEQRYGSRRHREDQHEAPGRISVSKRLQGRISLPGRMPAQTDANVSDKAVDSVMDWVGRPSVGRPSSQQGRQRVRQRSSEEFPSGERTPVHIPKNEDAEKSVAFSRPKRLSELKVAKPSGISDQRSSRGTKETHSVEQKDTRLRRALGNHQETESADFEGPKSLSDILRRKREAAGHGQCKEDSDPDNGPSDNSMAAAAMIPEEVASVNPLETATGEEEEEGMILTDEQGQEGQYYDIADDNEYIQERPEENDYVQERTEEFEQVEGEYEYEQNEEGEEYYYEDEEAYLDRDYQEEGAYQEEEGMGGDDGTENFAEKVDEPMPN